MNCTGNIMATDFQSANGPSLLSLHRELADVRRYVGMRPPAAPPAPPPPASPPPPPPPPMQPPPSSPPSPEYVGCFSQGFCATSSIGNTNSATACRDAAVQGGFSYFGLACPNTIWNGFNCFSCNNITLPSPLADSQCTSSAGSGGSSCGCTGYPYGTYSQSGFYLGGCNNMALYRLP